MLLMAIFLAILTALLLQSSSAVLNNETADIGLALCYVDFESAQPGSPRRMSELLKEIADTWPIGEGRMRIGIIEAINRVFRQHVQLRDGNNPTKLRNASLHLAKDSEISKNASWDIANVTKVVSQSRGLLFNETQIVRERRKAPQLLVFLTVFRSNVNYHEGDWIKRRFNRDVAIHLGKGAKFGADVSALFETGYKTDGGVAYRTSDTGFNQSCCVTNIKSLASAILIAIRSVLHLCPLKVTKTRCLVSGSRLVVNVTYAGQPKVPAVEKYCWNRTEQERCHRKATIAWAWFGSCLGAICIATMLAIYASVRQIVFYLRDRQEQREMMTNRKRKPAVQKTIRSRNAPKK